MIGLRYAVFGVAFMLSACGSTTEERGLSGAGIGAAAGAVIGAVTGLSIVQGVVIGAAAGGLTGVLTDEETIDLGDPVWKKDKPDSSGQQSGNAVDSGGQLVRNIQEALSEMGYDPGPADEIIGPKTTAAIRQYQEDHGLPIDGNATPELAAHMQEQKAASAQQAGASEL